MADARAQYKLQERQARQAVQEAKSLDALPPQKKQQELTWSYFFIRILFYLVLKVFYSSIVVEGVEHLPADGTPVVLCANHTNSLTDALLLVVSVPRYKRAILRLTAKATQFGRGTFTSWLIESAGTLPLKRVKDLPPAGPGEAPVKVDNSEVWGRLVTALRLGDAVALFPEGLSRYYPQLAQLRTGVARILSDVLSLERDNDSFEIAVQTCSITYLHRDRFRSDVLVTFHPPLKLTPKTHADLVATPDQPADFNAVRTLTSTIGETIRSGTLDAPSWNYIRLAHTARRMYAPVGTQLSLGDTVRLTQRFVDALAGKKAIPAQTEGLKPDEKWKAALKTPMTPRFGAEKAKDYFQAAEQSNEGGGSSQEEIDRLAADLKVYQDLLFLHGVRDERVLNPKLRSRTRLIRRLVTRIAGALFLFVISIPGLVLWTPVFVVAGWKSKQQRKSGPVYDTYDEVAQTKLVYGLLTYLAVYAVCLVATWPIFPVTLVGVPTLLWVSLRWMEDGLAALRAAMVLFRLLHLGQPRLSLLREMREGLQVRVLKVAVQDCGLPEDVTTYVESPKRWRNRARYFSLRARRKKDWFEVFRAGDDTEIPDNWELDSQ